MDYTRFCKSFLIVVLSCSTVFVGGCTVNPATGEQQFTGLMSPSQEQELGAKEHREVIKEYGGVYNHPGLQAYVNEVGQRVAKNTERSEVTYRFTLLDTPVVNAFALPGGYVYITRGILTVANDEDELAAVLAHEIGHVTGRHQAARYSQGVLTSLGANIIGAVVGNQGVTQILDLGTNLYMSSYSRDQESEADNLGIRYLTRSGYDQFAMARFLNHMDFYDKTRRMVSGDQKDGAASFFSTHPITSERVAASSVEAGKYSGRSVNAANVDRYLSKIRGMTYGDSLTQGFVRNNIFYHPDLGFRFSIPQGYETINQPSQVVAKGKDGAVIVMDMADSRAGQGPMAFLMQDWLKGKRVMASPEDMTVNGFPAATIAANGTFNGVPSTIRLVAIQWGLRDIVRLQMVIPRTASAQTIEGLKRTTYSFRQMSEGEKRSVKPYSIQLVTAKTGDTVSSLARQMKVDQMSEHWFRAINGIGANEQIVSGRRYKVVQ